MPGRWDPRDSLSPFYEDGFIDEILFLVKSGKEATVLCCRAGAHIGVDLLAAKVYRPRERRSFHNDAVYTQGRHIGDSRSRRAVQNHSRKGMAMAFGMWTDHEASTLAQLHAAGVRVPRLITSGGGVLLMEFIGDADGAAPRLADIDLSPTDARRCLPDVLRQVETMLACGHVHGDLSPYNILHWEGAATLIDVPQTVDPWRNPDALDLLVRDLTNVLDYFVACGVRCPHPERVARDLWQQLRLGGTTRKGREARYGGL
jgi:RIO kinase 1